MEGIFRDGGVENPLERALLTSVRISAMTGALRGQLPWSQFHCESLFWSALEKRLEY